MTQVNDSFGRIKYYCDVWYCDRKHITAVINDLKTEFGARRVSVTYKPHLDHARIGKNFAIFFIQRYGKEFKIIGNIGQSY